MVTQSEVADMMGTPELWRQIIPVAIIGLSWLSVGIGLAFTAVTGLDMVQEGILTSDQLYLFASIFMIGMSLGGPLGSQLLDKFGRKVTFLCVCCVSVLGWVTVASNTKPAILYIGRLLIGLSSGLSFIAGNVYTSEITTGRLRGKLTMVLNVTLTGGFLMTMTVGVYLPWRYLALLAAAVLVVSMVGTLLLPDSPRWLLLNNRRSEAKEALCTLRGVHVDIQPELVEMEQSVLASVSASFTLSHLRDRGYYKPALLSFLVTFIQQASGSSIFLSYLDIILRQGGWKDTNVPTISVGVTQFIAGLASIYAIARVGRRAILFINMVVMCVSEVVIGFMFYFKDVLGQEGSKYLCLTAILLYFFSFNIGVGAVCPLLRTELLPTKLRATVSGFVSFWAWIGAFVLTQGYPYVAAALNEYGAFWILASVLLISIVVVFVVLPETKDLSLEEIEALFAEGDRYKILTTRQTLLNTSALQPTTLQTYGSRS